MNAGETTVLICPLDWGLGHASRVIPLVKHYIKAGYRVILGGSGKSGELLQTIFKDIPFLLFPSVAIRYPFRANLFFLNIFLQLPAFLYSALRDHFQLKKNVEFHGINIVISDNRYGLFYKSVRSIIITHQISPVLPGFLRWAEYPVHLILKYIINNFDECWIPDYPGDKNLSGKLSHRYTLPKNARYVGLLSRFSVFKGNGRSEHYDGVIILSGLQPELRRLTYKMIDQATKSSFKILIICGFQEIQYKASATRSDLEVVSHLEPVEFRNAIENSSVVICTAGYSGIMDLVEIGKPAILIPTRGQTEQEYLARYLDTIRLFIRMKESKINLNDLDNYIKKVQQCIQFKTENPTISGDFPNLS